jgi:hypothetical protein
MSCIWVFKNNYELWSLRDHNYLKNFCLFLLTVIFVIFLL